MLSFPYAEEGILAPRGVDGRLDSPPAGRCLSWASSPCLPPRTPSSVLFLPCVCLSDGQGPFSKRRSLQPGNRCLGLRGVRHVDEAKAPRAASHVIRDDLDACYRTIGVKEQRQVFFCSRKGQIPDKNLGVSHLLHTW